MIPPPVRAIGSPMKCFGPTIFAIACLAAASAFAGEENKGVNAFGLTPKLVAAQSDSEVIESCLAGSAESPYACIGSVAVVCVKLTMPQGTRHEASCTERERTVWQTRLEASITEVNRSLPASARKRFATLQRAWQNYYTLKCDFMSDDLPQERSATMQKGCQLREIAARSIEVERYLKHQKKRQRS
ncbi:MULTISPECIES: lysozyme inhibitor LprI family protein [unclassified Chelatococcus]|uniref:lysozyme inhibitor LprI family protein n=1 Tax=unclassified Chelatococcus TaxID=2638111 RepID=UPI001BCEDB76|nr:MULTISPECIES: lysozyme inhibitor LprI family protein [unclassified Chelatococcus]MBS7698216.1 DUF1311 domain-containing protein [Chelatococcus sp. YT9]MBX3559864.1 DUF1311 domain-containing protein [Chelatococcus sp.]